MTEPTFDRPFWEARWSEVLRDHADQVARRPPNEWLTTEVADLEPGRALDAGCGHGSETLWLAARGWHVTAVDFSATALAHGRATAETVGADVAARIDWVEGDLSAWAPEPGQYDLVVSLYVHVADSVEAMVQRLAAGVAPGGAVFLVGHQPIDPATGAETPAAGQLQVSVDAATAALDPDQWTLLVAEDRPRPTAGTGVDAVIRAYRGSVDHDREAELDQVPTEASGDDQDEPFERPVDRFRKGAVGSVVAAGLLGLADALEARPPKEEVVIVQEAPTQPPLEPRRLELLLDPEHPERSMVFLPAPTDEPELPDDAI